MRTLVGAAVLVLSDPALRRSGAPVSNAGLPRGTDDGFDFAASTRGATWTNAGDLGGYRSGVAWVSGTRDTAIAVGPTGSDVTTDGGRTWTTFDDVQYDAVQSTRTVPSGPASRRGGSRCSAADSVSTRGRLGTGRT